MAPRPGFEPRLGESKSPVLPLHNQGKVVRAAGFEPTIFCSQSRRDSQVTLHLDKKGSVWSLCIRISLISNVGRYIIYVPRWLLFSQRINFIFYFG